jgi:hypothetical protein
VGGTSRRGNCKGFEPSSGPLLARIRLLSCYSFGVWRHRNIVIDLVVLSRGAAAILRSIYPISWRKFFVHSLSLEAIQFTWPKKTSSIPVYVVLSGLLPSVGWRATVWRCHSLALSFSQLTSRASSISFRLRAFSSRQFTLTRAI